MYEVSININVKIAGCPLNGLAAADFRVAHGLDPRPDNRFVIVLKEPSDELLCRRFADALTVSANLRIDTGRSNLEISPNLLARVHGGDEVEVRKAIIDVVDVVLADIKADEEKYEKERREMSEIEARRRQANKEEEERREAEETKIEVERIAWINEFGSDHLKMLVDEGIECKKIYRRERIQMEYPGWKRYWDVNGHIDDPKNPSAAAMLLLTTARASGGEKTESAELRWFEDDESNEDWDDEGNDLRWKGYVAWLPKSKTFPGCDDLVYGAAPDKR